MHACFFEFNPRMVVKSSQNLNSQWWMHRRLVLGWLNSFSRKLQGDFLNRSTLWSKTAPLRSHLRIRSLVSLASQSLVSIGFKNVLSIQTVSLAANCSGFLAKQFSSISLWQLWLFMGWKSVLVSLVSNFLVAISSITESNSDTQISIMAKRKAHMQTLAAEVAESMEDNFTSTQRLSIKVDSHSSTISFALDTLAQHRMLIGQS